ncbi:MAG TPA: ABC transporter ATP-binding protein [Bradyrhizobium sp.]|uniref:ABC transporter ATP-binding protein n=1 Tax=Bradyrhizobium sp. TaxID=376 RepID=UPI002B52FC9C|nr:ABC transporter ATP-binding protein [Bradyrhizobium sp.]HLZ03759.1 ABC transporter ATP-binding protein [Bradyrhizobium sp.]
MQHVSLSIMQGEFVSLVGPSGCGKTTLMNMVAGFLRPTRGSVTLDGKAIAGPGPDRGVMFQDYGVFPWLSVEDNVAFGLRLAANRRSAQERAATVERYLRLMGLWDFRKAYPKTLSGGMRQRLALARAYAVNPEFLLMDEPFGALDAQTRSAMHDLLLDVLHAEGKTVLLITHSVEEAVYLSTKVVVISARPSRIREVIDIPFAYPRRHELQDTHEFGALKSRIYDLVMREYAAQEAQRKPADYS